MEPETSFSNERESIIARWKAAFGQYDMCKAAAEPAVARWEWSIGERYQLLPFGYQRFPGRPRALKTPPEQKSHYTETGLDDQNRPRLLRQYDYMERPFETFYLYGDTLTEILKFSIPPRIPLMVQQVVYEQGRVVRSALFGLNGYTPLLSQKGDNPQALYEWLGPNGRFVVLEHYVYEGDRLAKILAYCETPQGSEDPSHEFEDRFSYDEAGKLLQIERLHNYGVSETLYRRRPKGQTFAMLRAEATQKLTEAIVERLRTAKIQERLYCVELSYREVTHYFPPYIIPGPESFRQELLNSGDLDARYYIFAPVVQSPMGPDQWLEITAPETLEICQQLEQAIQTGSKWTMARRILRDVAAALTRHDWTGALDVTDDFVVFAIDHEMNELTDALRASASKEQMRAWKQKGWI